jgi:hypothetical protein
MQLFGSALLNIHAVLSPACPAVKQQNFSIDSNSVHVPVCLDHAYQDAGHVPISS